MTINRQAKCADAGGALETLNEALASHTLSVECPSCQTAFVLFDRQWLKKYDSKTPVAWLSSEIACPHCANKDAKIVRTFSIVKAMSQ